MSDLKTRFIQIVATERHLTIMWKDEAGCQGNKDKYHRASVLTARSEIPMDPAIMKSEPVFPEYDDPIWPKVCNACGAAPAEGVKVTHSGSAGGVYNTPSGRPEPGDLYFADWMSCTDRGKCHYGWTNCDGKHLHAICPNGHAWDIDARASNCTLPQDTTHRCWIRHGEPPDIHVDKNGHTCAAGAGSIIAGDYHGFLHHGKFTGC